MKKLIIIAFLSFIIQCQSQKKYNNMIPIIDNRFEKFNNYDIEEYKKNQSNDTYIKIKNEEIKIISLFKLQYIVNIYNTSKLFKLTKTFYSNGNIKSKSLSFNNGSPIEKIYYYNESGILLKEEDTDANYDFKPIDILRFCEKNNIELPKGYQNSGFQNSVIKMEWEGKKVWKIEYALPMMNEREGPKIKAIILDGKNGKILNEKIHRFN